MKKKVLHLLASNKFSGAENVACTIIENDQQYDMFYCSKDGEIRKILESRNIKYIPINRLTPFAVRKILKEYKIDIVHAHDFQASFVSALTNFKGKIISHIHCNPNFIKTWNMFSIAYNLVSKRFDSIIFVSEDCIKNTVFYKNIKSKTKIIHNIVDNDKVLKLASVDNEDKCDLVFLGRLIDLKQPQLVIEIANILKKDNPKIKVSIIGDGPLYNECENLIKKYNLEQNVKMLGFQQNPFQYIKNAKIALMPSKYEGLGLVAIEAMILNIPVLNSGAGGLNAIFKENQEFICNGIDEYVKKIKELQDEKTYKKYQDNCKNMILNFTDVSKFINKINSLYEEEL